MSTTYLSLCNQHGEPLVGCWRTPESVVRIGRERTAHGKGHVRNILSIILYNVLNHANTRICSYWVSGIGSAQRLLQIKIKMHGLETISTVIYNRFTRLVYRVFVVDPNKH